MTAKTKTEIKAFFETGDQPTQSQFVDLIDSYIDRNGPVGIWETGASAGSTGVPILAAGAASIASYAAVRSSMGVVVYTTALAVAAVTSADANVWYGTQTYQDTVSLKGKFQWQEDGTRTVSAGNITILGTYHLVETQSSAATDDLDNIQTTGSGLLAILRAKSSARTVVLRHGTGNISTPDGYDIELDDTNKYATLLYDSDTAKWNVLANNTRPSVLVQYEGTAYSTYQGTGTVLPFDDSIPLNTEGVQIMSMTFTPKYASSTLEIEVDVHGDSGGGSEFVAALFVDATTSAIAMGATNPNGGGGMGTVNIRHKESSSSKTARTYKVNYGPGQSAVSAHVNGTNINAIGGGTMASRLRVYEYAT